VVALASNLEAIISGWGILELFRAMETLGKLREKCCLVDPCKHIPWYILRDF